ncbi:hypothetical protein Tco_1418414 [Tanacetum coccineum]
MERMNEGGDDESERENIIIISDNNSGSDNSSHSNNSSDSFGSTSSLISWHGEINTSEKYVHSSPDIVYSKGPSNSLLNWYEDLSDEYKERFWCSKSGEMCVQCVGFAYLIGEMIVLSSDSSDNSKGPSIASVSKEGPSIQRLLDLYGYDTVEEYLEETFFPSTNKDTSKYVPVSQKHNPKVKSPIPITGCVLGLANVHTREDILKKIEVRKPESCADKAKGKRKVAIEAMQMQASIYRLQLQVAFAACNLQVAFALHLQLVIKAMQMQASICNLQFAGYICIAFATCN